jgi:hypothetical protein
VLRNDARHVKDYEGGTTLPDLAIAAIADAEARRLGVTRESVIKVWIAERLGQPSPGAA